MKTRARRHWNSTSYRATWGLIVLLASLVACGGSAGDGGGGITNPPPAAKKLDPYVTVRVRDLMDTTTAPGRAHWHIYVAATGLDNARNDGIGFQGTIGLNDLRLGHSISCVSAAADSVGQRLLAVLAIADTTTSNLTPDSSAQALASAWYNGNHVLPAGWMALTFAPTDAWDSQQYLAGHGLTTNDPIKWGLDWTDRGTVSFYERTDTDPICARF